MLVTVFGSARLAPDTAEYDEGFRLGRMLAQRGHTVVSGGYGGIMEAVSRGAHDAGGHVVGVTVAPWAHRITPNQYLGEERSTATLYERLEGLVESDALIALTGGAGTLAEIALAWNLRQMNLVSPKPVILVGPLWSTMVDEFREHLIIDEDDLALLTVVDTIEEAVASMEGSDLPQGEWRG